MGVIMTIANQVYQISDACKRYQRLHASDPNHRVRGGRDWHDYTLPDRYSPSVELPEGFYIIDIY